MKILFLDIDGVLCTNRSLLEPTLPFPEDFHIPFRTGWERLDKECIKRLNQIINETGAKIVVSSTWRLKCNTEHKFRYIIDYLHNEGVVADIIDKTPGYYLTKFQDLLEREPGVSDKSCEIQEWLRCAYDTIESFVIIDDDSNMGNLSGSHVCTDEPIGLQDCGVEKAIKILGKKQ
jgi:hypothetical protein